ncbi:MAG: adenylate/guanylate cyclase domain-containing protein [Chitinophagales bacterium]
MTTTTRQLAAIMFTDLVGYTALMQVNEQLAVQKRDRNKVIFENALGKYDGKILQYYGDGTMSIFSSAVNAIRSAIEMQTLNRQEKIDLRIGIHIGDVMFDDNGIYGDSVNVASRLESLATPGSVFISEKLYDDIKNNDGISAIALGYFELKNVKQPMQVFAIANEGIVVPSRDDVKGKVKQTLNSIAVLPFASLSSDPENEFFSDGITEELINVLAQVDGLQVTSRTSAFAFKAKNEDVREIAAKLNVQKIIEGSVRKSGNKVRITAQLINAWDGYHLWSATYDRELEDIFAVQDEIARAIANKLKTNFSTELYEAPLAITPTKNLEAYKKYLQGAYNWDNLDPKVRNRSMELLHEAVEMDPDFANAHAVLANIYLFPGYITELPPDEVNKRFHHHAEEALRAQPLNPKSLVAMASVKFRDWDWTSAYELLMKANEINPSEPSCYFMLGEYYVLMLEKEKAEEVAMRIAEVDPMSPRSLAESGRIFLSTGNNEKTLEMAERSLALNPHNFLALQLKGYALVKMGEAVEGTQVLLENHKIAGDHPFVLAGLAFCYGYSGELEKLKLVEEKFRVIYDRQPNPEFGLFIGFMRMMSGDLPSLYTFFDEAIKAKSTFALQMYGDDFCKAIWQDEHVRQARKKFGLPVYN